MGLVEVKLPKMGESVMEATITTWLKAVGETVEEEESIVEIATDKVDSEVPSPVDGVLKEIRFQEGEVAKVGEVIAVIEAEGEGDMPAAQEEPAVAAAPESIPAPEAAQPEITVNPDMEPAAQGPVDLSGGSRFYSPLVKTIAKKEGIPMSELEQIEGTGENGRVTKKDILAYIESGRPHKGGAQPTAATPAPKAQAATAAPAVSAPQGKPSPEDFGGNVEIIEMDRMRKIIAKHMVESKHTSPHVTSFVEADVTSIVNWRNKMKGEFLNREGEKLTFTPIFIEAVVKALKDFPMVNVSVQGDYIIKKLDINIGMATALPSGNLIVPVIHNADQLNLVGLAKKVNDLAKRARENKLLPDEIAGGTYTVTNVGTFGNVFGTPVINQPQVAILALGAIRKVPAVIETPEGDMIAIRHKMFLSHAYDHRVVDGALGGMFVRRVADYLEAFDPNREL